MAEPTEYINISGNKINPNAGTNKIHISPSEMKGCCEGGCVAQFKTSIREGNLTITVLPLLGGRTQTGSKITITDGKGGIYSTPITANSLTVAVATLATYLDTTQELTAWVDVMTDDGDCKGVARFDATVTGDTYSQNYMCPLAVLVDANITDTGTALQIVVTGLVVESGANNAPVSWGVSYWAPGDEPGVDAPTGTITQATSSPVTIAGAANGVWKFMITSYVLVGNNCTETLSPTNYNVLPASQKHEHTQAA